MNRKHIGGKGISGRHSSVIPLAHEMIRYALTKKSVDRCAPGLIKVKKTAMRALRLSYTKKFITATVIEKGLIQQVRIFGADTGGSIDEICVVLEGWAQEKGMKFSKQDKSNAINT